MSQKAENAEFVVRKIHEKAEISSNAMHTAQTVKFFAAIHEARKRDNFKEGAKDRRRVEGH